MPNVKDVLSKEKKFGSIKKIVGKRNFYPSLLGLKNNILRARIFTALKRLERPLNKELRVFYRDLLPTF